MAKGTRVTIEKIPLNKIKLNKNSRLNIDPDELDGLMQSIKEEGLLQPIGVVKSGATFEICYGNRRFMAVSKLGLSSIPAIVHEKKKESDVDIKNLTENIQRRNISLAEVGRYLELLEKQGLSRNEAAVRLGVSRQYVGQALSAFREIPKEFRDDLEIRVVKKGNVRGAAGKIGIHVAQKILSAVKTGKIDNQQSRSLFKAAKSDYRFQSSKIERYIDAAASGHKQPIEAVGELKFVQLKFFIPQPQYEEIMEKHVVDGPFNSLTGFMLAVLRGDKHMKINVLKE